MMEAETKNTQGQGLDDVLLEIMKIEDEITKERESHNSKIEELKQCLEHHKHTRDLMSSMEITADQIDLARKCISINGKISESAGGAYQAALEAVAAGGQALLKQYIGAKRYEGFHQRCDSKYGYGPKHGSIVFSVGLMPHIRNSCHRLTEDEVEACVRYLTAEKKLSDDLARTSRW